MRKIIARIAAFIVCVFAAVFIYYSVQDAYFTEAVNDFINEGENFAQGEPVNPDEVEEHTTDGKFIHAIAVYLKQFQDLNNEMDTETTKMVGAFDPKNLQNPQSIKVNLDKMEEYRALVQRDSDLVEKSAQQLISTVGGLDQESLKIGNIQQLKSEFAQNQEFRKNIADVRKTVASYMYAALEFVQSRQADISFAENGAILFKSPADQKYFNDLLGVIQQSTQMLKGLLAKDREELRGNVADLKKAYQQQQ